MSVLCVLSRSTALLYPGRFLIPHFCSVGYNPRSEEHTSELQSRQYLECRLLLEKKKNKKLKNEEEMKKDEIEIQETKKPNRKNIREKKEQNILNDCTIIIQEYSKHPEATNKTLV